MKWLITIILTISLFSCKDIKVTKEFIKNGYWDPDPRIGQNILSIRKMQVDNDSIYYYTKEHNALAYSYLSIDTSFVCGINFEKNRVNTIHFGKEIKWQWNVGKDGRSYKTYKLGQLENGNWYKFSHLKKNDAYYLYVYIDSLGKSHQYSINLANY